MRAKNQRLTLVIVAMVAVSGAVLLAMSAAKDKAAYFRSPADIAKVKPPAGEAFRLDLYWSPCCGAGRGNATYFAGIGTSATTDVTGHAHFWVKLPAVAYPSVGRLGATATRMNGDTSEMGDSTPEIVGDMVFRDDFE